MSIRFRLLWILALVFGLYSAADLALRYRMVWPSFDAWEQQVAMQEVSRFEQRIEQELAVLDELTQDWAAWDESGNVASGRKPAHSARQFTEATLKQSDLDLVAIYNAKGERLLLRSSRVLINDLELQLTPARLSEIHRLRHFREQTAANQRSNGLLITTHGPWLLTARPILHNDNRGSAAGVLVLGRQLSSGRLVQWARQQGVTLDMAFQADVPPIEGSGFAHSTLNQSFSEQGNDLFRASREWVSADGLSRMTLTAQVDRSHSQNRLDAARLAWLYAVGIGTAILFILVWLLNRSFVRPILALADTMRQVVEKSNYSLRPRIRRRDEIGQLAIAFEELLNRIEGQNAARNLKSQRLQQLAGTDGLTGIGNRRALEEYLEQCWHRSQQQQVAMSVILCDIDHFKLYNDHYGHLDGDECLRQVATIMHTHIHREMDRLFRYGGEEFVVILPNTELEGAIQLAEKLRKAIQRCQLVHEKTERGFVTLSLGVASAIGGKAPAQLLIDAADRALYTSKEKGRNRVSASKPISLASHSRRRSDSN